MQQSILTAARSLTLAIGLLGVFAADAQAAQSASEPFDAEDPGMQDAYLKAVRDGVSEYDARHFEEALGYFRNAHHLNPNARTFRGIGMTAFELRDYITAMRNLTAALEDRRKPLSAGQRRETQELVERCRMFVARYKVTVSPPDAQVTVDAKAAEYQSDGTLMLGLGEHLIEARAEGYDKRSLSVQVRGGERNELFLTLDPTEPAKPAAATPPAADSAPDLLTAKPTIPRAPSNRAAKTWLLAGASAALLAVGTGVYWRLQESELSSCHAPAPGFRCTDESALVQQRNIGVVSTIVAGTAALTMVTIGVLSWKSAPRGTTPKQALACQVGVFGITCGRTF
jgi:tetratricopeptide (TPR) repeat protein